jgi:hypothetical protein
VLISTIEPYSFLYEPPTGKWTNLLGLKNVKSNGKVGFQWNFPSPFISGLIPSIYYSGENLFVFENIIKAQCGLPNQDKIWIFRKDQENPETIHIKYDREFVGNSFNSLNAVCFKKDGLVVIKNNSYHLTLRNSAPCHQFVFPCYFRLPRSENL